MIALLFLLAARSGDRTVVAVITALYRPAPSFSPAACSLNASTAANSPGWAPPLSPSASSPLT